MKEIDIDNLANEVYKRLNNESNSNFKKLNKLIEKREKCYKKLVIMYNDKLAKTITNEIAKTGQNVHKIFKDVYQVILLKIIIYCVILQIMKR